jgi:hypothetical protein
MEVHPPPFTAAAPRHYLAAAVATSSTGQQAETIVRYGGIIRHFAKLALRHPALIPPLLAAAWRFRRRDWYRRAPFLPVPPPEYVAWRLHTAYGSEDALPPAADLQRYLRWTRRVRSGA